jgi:hypothetical protein
MNLLENTKEPSFKLLSFLNSGKLDLLLDDKPVRILRNCIQLIDKHLQIYIEKYDKKRVTKHINEEKKADKCGDLSEKPALILDIDNENAIESSIKNFVLHNWDGEQVTIGLNLKKSLGISNEHLLIITIDEKSTNTKFTWAKIFTGLASFSSVLLANFTAAPSNYPTEYNYTGTLKTNPEPRTFNTYNNKQKYMPIKDTYKYNSINVNRLLPEPQTNDYSVVTRDNTFSPSFAGSPLYNLDQYLNLRKNLENQEKLLVPLQSRINLVYQLKKNNLTQIPILTARIQSLKEELFSKNMLYAKSLENYEQESSRLIDLNTTITNINIDLKNSSFNTSDLEEKLATLKIQKDALNLTVNNSKTKLDKEQTFINSLQNKVLTDEETLANLLKIDEDEDIILKETLKKDQKLITQSRSDVERANLLTNNPDNKNSSDEE